MMTSSEVVSLLSYFADIASLVEAIAMLLFGIALIYAIIEIKKFPNSFFRIRAEGIGEAEMSVGDVSFLIADQLEAVEEPKRDLLRLFNTEDGTASSEIEPQQLGQLEARGVIRRYKNKHDQITVRLSPLGYRLLKEFMKVENFMPTSKKIEKREGETLL